jgi:hypothetical protein
VASPAISEAALLLATVNYDEARRHDGLMAPAPPAFQP